ncbi:MAG: small multi-drug export protein [Peptostreptococcaceae bacterium]|nr:small multi-drug export protein [Peptostreptococcaceae bacterium]MDY5739039.1 small multi-drug export protein [Anaerovoracaceae bacterium]
MYAVFMTLLLSMTPILELRAAIPAGVAGGLSIWTTLIIAIIGNFLPVPVILLFVRKVFDIMREKSEKLNRFVLRMEAKAKEKQSAIDKYEWWGLVLLVAIPLPGTGAWTGALVAAMLDMRLQRALPAILLGIIIAGVAVSYLTYGAKVLIGA